MRRSRTNDILARWAACYAVAGGAAAQSPAGAVVHEHARVVGVAPARVDTRADAQTVPQARPGAVFIGGVLRRGDR